MVVFVLTCINSSLTGWGVQPLKNCGKLRLSQSLCVAAVCCPPEILWTSLNHRRLQTKEETNSLGGFHCSPSLNWAPTLVDIYTGWHLPVTHVFCPKESLDGARGVLNEPLYKEHTNWRLPVPLELTLGSLNTFWRVNSRGVGGGGWVRGGGGGEGEGGSERGRGGYRY